MTTDSDHLTSTLLCPGYEPGDGSAEGAQLVDLAWWHPVVGCDSLQIVMDNARSLLASKGRPAQPESAELTDEELECMRYYGFTTSTGHGERTDEIGFARAVLARWGRPAITPIPVSERLPGPEDCDTEGRCWCWAHQDGDDYNDWRWSDTPSEPIYGDNWGWKYLRSKDFHIYDAQLWLPHWAIPLPQPPTP